jgi:hypothetical protein
MLGNPRYLFDRPETTLEISDRCARCDGCVRRTGARPSYRFIIFTPSGWRDVWGIPVLAYRRILGRGRRNAMFCKGVTPARGIRFTATTPGTEECITPLIFY